MPMESMSTASAPVKYFVVNHAKSAGRLSAQHVQMTVQTGKRLVTRDAVDSYLRGERGR